MYQPRMYRQWVKGDDLVAYTVVVKETDLYIRSLTNLSRKAYRLVLKHRGILEGYIAQHPGFAASLEPLPLNDEAPQIVQAMIKATAAVGVGPMASVAGAIAQFVGEELAEFSPEIIIENGGDIYLRSRRDRLVGIYAGDSPLSGKLGFQIAGKDTPLGICTSSGTVGHSLSFGNADAVVIVSKSAILADAAATALGNMVNEPQDISRALKFGEKITGLTGVVIIKGEAMGAWGNVKLQQL